MVKEILVTMGIIVFLAGVLVVGVGIWVLDYVSIG